VRGRRSGRSDRLDGAHVRSMVYAGAVTCAAPRPAHRACPSRCADAILLTHEMVTSSRASGIASTSRRPTSSRWPIFLLGTMGAVITCAAGSARARRCSTSAPPARSPPVRGSGAGLRHRDVAARPTAARRRGLAPEATSLLLRRSALVLKARSGGPGHPAHEDCVRRLGRAAHDDDQLLPCSSSTEATSRTRCSVRVRTPCRAGASPAAAARSRRRRLLRSRGAGRARAVVARLEQAGSGRAVARVVGLLLLWRASRAIATRSRHRPALAGPQMDAALTLVFFVPPFMPSWPARRLRETRGGRHPSRSLSAAGLTARVTAS